MEAGRQGGREAGRHRGREAGRQGGREAGRQGGREAGRQGGREAGRQGAREKETEICNFVYFFHFSCFYYTRNIFIEAISTGPSSLCRLVRSKKIGN